MSLPASHCHASVLQQLLSHDPLAASFVSECCAGQQHVALSYLADLFQRVWVLETSQHMFYQHVVAAYQDRMQPAAAHATSDNVRRSGLLMLLAGQDWQQRGFQLLPYPVALSMVLRSLMLYRAETLLDAPRSLVRPVFHAQQYPRSIQQYLMTQWLAPHSADREFWSNDERRLLLSTESFLCYDDHIIQQHSSTCSESVQLVRADHATSVPQDPTTTRVPLQLQVAEVSLDRVLAMAQQYLCYQLARLPVEELRKLQQAQLVPRLFPLLISILRGDDLDHEHPLVQRLWRWHRAVLEMLDQTAESVRVFSGNLTARKLQHPQMPLLLSLYRRTYALAEYNNLYRDIRHSMTLQRGLPRFTLRWIYMPSSEEQSFSSFVCEHNAQCLRLEHANVSQWLRHQCLRSVDTERMLSAVGVYDDSSAMSAMRELRELDQQLVVLRFPQQAVRLSELELSLQSLLLANGALLHCVRATDDSSTLQSRVFTCGADHRGTYLLVLRDYLTLMRQIFFRETMSSYRYHKNMPVFPLMLRFWMGSHDTGFATEDGRPQTSEEALRGARLPGWFLDQHAQQCVLQVLCYQLQLDMGRTDPDRTSKKRGRSSFVPHLPADRDFALVVRLLNRLASVLERGADARKQAFPDMAGINALRRFLELGRPLQARTCTFVGNGLPPQSDDDWHTVENAGAWYEQMVQHAQPEQVHQWLCDPTNHYVRAEQFVHLKQLPVCYRVAQDTPLKLERYLQSYLQCFSTPYNHNQLSLSAKYRAAHEPMHSLVKVLLYVEACNSPAQDMRLLLQNMQGFDARVFFSESNLFRQHDLRSQIPLQARAARDTSASVGEFVFYEQSVAILVMCGSERVHLEHRAAVTSPQQQPHVPVENIFLDMLLRFRKHLTLARITDTGSTTTLRQLQQHMEEAQEEGKDPFRRSSNRFDDVCQLRMHLHSFLSEQSRQTMLTMSTPGVSSVPDSFRQELPHLILNAVNWQALNVM
jgi:hypothetical protein